MTTIKALAHDSNRWAMSERSSRGTADRLNRLVTICWRSRGSRRSAPLDLQINAADDLLGLYCSRSPED